MAELDTRWEAPGEHSLGVDDLMNELRSRRWTLYKWGPEADPTLLVGQCYWPNAIDSVIIRPDGMGCAYRCPTAVPDPFRPNAVMFQWAGASLWALRTILALEPPDHPNAPVHLHTPIAECSIPADLPRPFVMRPLWIR